MIFDHMKDKLKELNDTLLQREHAKPNKHLLREELKELGHFQKIIPATNEELRRFSAGKGIVGVDGSYTTIGNTFPHILFFAQALAKATNATDDGVRSSDVFNVFSDKQQLVDAENLFMSEYTKRVTAMEVKVATEAIEKYNPFLVMFDGGFWRLSKEAAPEWMIYKRDALQKRILSVGIIEDAGSYALYDQIKDRIDLPHFMPDSDILFGLLEYGEVFIMKTPFAENFLKVFARFSNDPLPIVCDFLKEQENDMLPILKIVHALTPKDGRGIPVWIDVVDKEVKITKEETDLIVESYLDQSLKERLFTGKRDRR